MPRRPFSVTRSPRGQWVMLAMAVMAAVVPGCAVCLADERPIVPVDARTLHRKVLCGYQGWFRCPGDGTGEGWLHWSRHRSTIRPGTLTVEMWPDLSEYSREERYEVPGFSHPDGERACLFSSANRTTVARHFDWMQQYGIDGIFLQRFLVNLDKPSFDEVLGHVRSSAASTGRTYAICYDLSGTPQGRIYELLVDDWKRLVDDEHITQDDRYLHQNDRPVLFVWGLFSDRFDAAIAHRLIDFLKGEERYRVTLIGGCPWWWRRDAETEWARVYRRLDVISPWNVGNYTTVQGNKVAATQTWQGDREEAAEHGAALLPVIYPGFGWTNLKGQDASGATIPRRGGEFFWEQFVTLTDLGIDMAYVAMFDEVDEATAIFKVSNTPPHQASFQTYEGRPADWYLRLTAEGAGMMRGERARTEKSPLEPDPRIP